MFTLAHLLNLVAGSRYAGDAAADTIAIEHVTADSRHVLKSGLFVAVSGGRADGHRYIPGAFAAGAVAAMGTATAQSLRAAGLLDAQQPYVQVVDSRSSLAVACAVLHDFPSRKLAVIGVTGTDGKTTTCTLLESILMAASATPEAPRGRVGVVTTVGARILGQESDTGLHVTTPDATEVQQFLGEMVAAGCRYAVIESTSHGLAQARVAAVDFDVAAVTNITHEHLDYHGTRDAYVAAKALLFRSLYGSPAKPRIPRCAVLNADDAGSYGALLSVLNEEAHEHDYRVQVRSYGLPDHGKTRLDVAALNVEYGVDQTRFLLRWWGGEFTVETRLIGEFNVYNVLCAATTALTLNASPTAVQAGIRAVSGVIGRMERIDRGQQFLAVVDFAHTPNSLERALQTLRPLVAPHADGSPGRLIAVFGSAGLRDRAKRGLMGCVSGELADFTVITAEDPRTEDLDAICAEIAAGVREFAGESHFAIVPDRSEAIQYAVNLAQAGDVVGAFGKGHERSMCFGEIEHPWSDQDAMATALESRVGKN